MSQRIIIVMEGGIIQDIVGIPPGLAVEVRDFDVEDLDPTQEDIRTVEGEDYLYALWEPPADARGEAQP